MWNYVFKRTYAYYDLAGEAYVKYLGLCGDEPVSGTISASLKILHLTINHTMELQVCFLVNADPWQKITKLFKKSKILLIFKSEPKP